MPASLPPEIGALQGPNFWVPDLSSSAKGQYPPRPQLFEEAFFACTIRAVVQRAFQYRSLALGHAFNQNAVQGKRMG